MRCDRQDTLIILITLSVCVERTYSFGWGMKRARSDEVNQQMFFLCLLRWGGFLSAESSNFSLGVTAHSPNTYPFHSALCCRYIIQQLFDQARKCNFVIKVIEEWSPGGMEMKQKEEFFSSFFDLSHLSDLMSNNTHFNFFLDASSSTRLLRSWPFPCNAMLCCFAYTILLLRHRDSISRLMLFKVIILRDATEMIKKTLPIPLQSLKEGRN